MSGLRERPPAPTHRRTAAGSRTVDTRLPALDCGWKMGSACRVAYSGCPTANVMTTVVHSGPSCPRKNVGNGLTPSKATAGRPARKSLEIAQHDIMS